MRLLLLLLRVLLPGWLLILFFLSSPMSAFASCAVSPPALTTLVWPASGPLADGWSLDCSSDRGHRGIDISVSAGSSIVAAAGGAVAFVGFTPAEGGGNTVAISHAGGYRTTYLHLAEVSVSVGQILEAGDTIGIAGGRALHFGVKLENPGDFYINPLDYLPPLTTSAPPEMTRPAAAMEPPVAGADTVTAAPLPATDPVPATAPAPAAATLPVAGAAPVSRATGSAGSASAIPSRENNLLPHPGAPVTTPSAVASAAPAGNPPTAGAPGPLAQSTLAWSRLNADYPAITPALSDGSLRPVVSANHHAGDSGPHANRSVHKAAVAAAVLALMAVPAAGSRIVDRDCSRFPAAPA